VSPEKHVLTFLFYIAHRAPMLNEIADRFDISESMVHKIIRRMAAFIHSVSAEFIQWPTGNRRAEIQDSFRHISGIPNIIGDESFKNTILIWIALIALLY